MRNMAVVVKVNQYCRHVVGTKALFINSWSYDLVEDFFNWLDYGFCVFGAFVIMDLLCKPPSTLFVGEAIPDAVTCNHYKLIVSVSESTGDIWEGCYSLVFSMECGLIFVLEVAKSSA